MQQSFPRWNIASNYINSNKALDSTWQKLLSKLACFPLPEFFLQLEQMSQSLQKNSLTCFIFQKLKILDLK